MLVVERGEVARLLAALRERDVIALCDGCAPGLVAVLLIEVVLPPLTQRLVYLRLCDAAFCLVAVELVEWGIVIGIIGVEKGLHRAAVPDTGLIDGRLIVDDVGGRGVVHAVEIGLRRDIPVGIHVHLHLLALALFRGDHDDTVGSQGSVDRGGSGILQHRHRLHVVGVDLVERHVGGHIVDHDQRLCADAGGEGAYASQHGLVLAGIGIDLHPQTRHLTFQGGEHILVHHTVQLRGVHMSEGGCRPLTAQFLITRGDDDGLGQLCGLLIHLHIHCRLPFLHQSLIGFHADEAELEHGALLCHNRIVAVQIGHRMVVTVLDRDGHAVHGFAFGVCDGAFHHCLCHGSDNR